MLVRLILFYFSAKVIRFSEMEAYKNIICVKPRPKMWPSPKKKDGMRLRRFGAFVLPSQSKTMTVARVG